jgi:glycosyltransferase involved in cell wall biosynthesis
MAAEPGYGDAVRVSIVIPAFNSASYLDANVATVLAFLADHDLDGEVVMADDGSTDGTADSIRAAPNVRVLRLPHRGKGAAVRAGMLAATGEIRAFTDADLPYGLDALPLAISYIRDRRYHAVVGDRTLPGSIHQAPGPLRRALSELASFAFRTLVTGGIYDTQCGFKVFRGDIAGELFRLARIDGFAADVELIHLILRHRLELKRVPVQLQRNAPSSVRVIRDSARAIRDIASIRFNVALGRYRSPYLDRLLEDELQADLEAAARVAGNRTSRSRST